MKNATSKPSKNAPAYRPLTSLEKDADAVTAEDVRTALIRYDVACGDGSSTAKVTQLYREWQLTLAAHKAAA